MLRVPQKRLLLSVKLKRKHVTCVPLCGLVVRGLDSALNNIDVNHVFVIYLKENCRLHSDLTFSIIYFQNECLIKENILKNVRAG